jgi:hypothetical protein
VAVTAASLSPLQRRLVPGVADFLFVGMLAGFASPGLFADGDTGWHLWAGFQTLAHGPGPIRDALSYTRAGVPWRNVQWLAETLFALVYRHGGYAGLAVLAAGLLAATVVAAYRIAFHDSGDAVAALVVTALAALLLGLQALARPLLFSLPLLLAARELTRRPELRGRAVWLLPLLTALWSNLHPSAFVAPLLAAVTWATEPRDRRLAAATLLSLLALGATPWGFGWLAAMRPFGANRTLLAGIEEWQSPQFRDPRFRFLLVAVVAALGLRRGGPPLARADAWLGLVFLALTLLAARVAVLGMLVWVPVLARDLAAFVARSRSGAAGAWRAIGDSLAPFERVLRPGLWPALVVLVLIALAPRLGAARPDLARGFPPERFPAGALAEARRDSLGAKVFCLYAWGGYVSWEGATRWKIYMDGRAGFFTRDQVNDYVKITTLAPDWEAALSRAAPDWILLPPDAPITWAAPRTGRWREAWRDSLATVLVPAR